MRNLFYCRYCSAPVLFALVLLMCISNRMVNVFITRSDCRFVVLSWREIIHLALYAQVLDDIDI